MTCLVFPQNKKGNLIIGTDVGSGSFYFGNSESGSSTNSDVYKSSYTSFSLGVYPTIGYYFTDNLVAGTYFAATFSTNKYKSSTTANSSTSESKSSYVYFSLGPFARFYLGQDNGKGRLFVHVSAGFSLYPVYTYTYTPSDGSGYTSKYEKYFPWNLGLRIGYEHYLNTTIGLEFYIGYTYTHSKYDNAYDYPTAEDYTYNYASNDNGITIGAGLQIHLDSLLKKKK